MSSMVGIRGRKSGIRVRKSRGRKLGWLTGGAAVIFALLYWEQPLLLYVLSTLGICALFLVVAFANLKTENGELDGNDGS
jgi:hypothetical protein